MFTKNRFCKTTGGSAGGGAHLEDVVKDNVAEALAGRRQDIGGLLHLMLLVAGGLGILRQRRLLLFTHLVKLLLGLFEFADVPRGGEGEMKKLFRKKVKRYSAERKAEVGDIEEGS